MLPAGRKLLWNGAGVVVACVMALGVATSFARLGARSLWFDEITGGRVAELQTLAGILAARDMDSHPPAMAFAEHWSRYAFGLTEWSLRLPAAIASVAALAVVAALAWAWGERRVAWLAGVMAALSPTFVTYAHDARPYALAALFSGAATLCFVLGFRNRRKYLWFPLYAVFAALSFYTHYFTTLVVGSHLLVATLAWLRPLRPAAARTGKAYAVLFLVFIVAAAAAFAAAYPVFSKALYDRGRFPGGEMSVTPALVFGAWASVGWDRAAANALFLFAGAAGIAYLWRRHGGFVGLSAAAVTLVPIFLPVAVVRLTTQFWHPRFAYFAFSSFIVVAACGVAAMAAAVAPAARRRAGAAALAAVLAFGAARAVYDDAVTLRVFYTTEHQDFRGAITLVNRNRDWRSALLVWPFRNWDCYHYYTKTLGGPAANARPRAMMLQYFEDSPRTFCVSTDAEFNDEVVQRYPTTLRMRLMRADVLYHDRDYRTTADLYRNVSADVIAAPPGVVNNALGRLALQEGKPGLALGYFEAAAREKPVENADLFFLTDLYVEKGQYRRALKLIGDYVRRRPDEAWPYTKLAVVYMKMGDRNSAIAYYRRALWLDPAKSGWQDSMDELIAQRKVGRALIGYSDPRWE